MSAYREKLPPPNDPTAFELLCLDLWSDIWSIDAGAQVNGRSGQPQAGVDFFGRHRGRLVGVQCKQKDGQRTKVTTQELDIEVKKALKFKPKLDKFILATSGPRDVKIQKHARQMTVRHRLRRLF